MVKVWPTRVKVMECEVELIDAKVTTGVSLMV